MLERPKDWCFSKTENSMPDYLLSVDKILETHHNHLSFSAFAFASPEFKQLIKIQENKQKVLVGLPLDPKKKRLHLWCDGKKLATTPATDKDGKVFRGQYEH